MIPFTNHEDAGFLPEFFSEADPRPAREQLDANYQHGGGVHPIEGFTLVNPAPGAASLHYPDDRPFRERGRATLRDETLILFEADVLAIVQPDGSFLATRVD